MSKLVNNNNYYLFIDEIQFCQDFEGVLNNFLHIKNLDVYVAGSNSKLLPKDIISEFRERGDKIHLSPSSFKEFYSNSNNFDEAYNTYITFCEMSLVLPKTSDEKK